MFMHLAGLKIILPSTPADGKRLLKSPIRDNNPVVFFECSRLTLVTGPVPDGEYTVPIGVADVKRGGSADRLLNEFLADRDPDEARRIPR